MEWIVYAIVVIVAGIVSYYASTRAQKAMSVAPGEVEQPTVNQGDRFPKLFGTRYIKAPKVVWMGDVTTEPIQK
jgi:hypothetical protein